MKAVTTNEVKSFYDSFTVNQKKSGINTRHRVILNNLKKIGLKKNATVLEIGCGIGTLTFLLSKYINKGKILAADISSESINIAKEINRAFPQTDFLVTDMSDFKSSHTFDCIVLPDVLEHIPVEQHKNLFKRIRENIHPDGFVFINIPNPRCLEWLHKNKPELLQIIDQPLYTNELLNNIYPNDFYLESLKTYSLAYDQPDYQYLILRPNKPMENLKLKSKFRLFAQSVITRFS